MEGSGVCEYGLQDLANASVHEKIVRIRKGLKGTNEKPLIQRDFAKLIDYPINRYAEAEKTDRYGREEESPVEDELLEKLVMIAHANPYWLFDIECDSWFGREDPDDETVRAGDEPCIYAAPDVILKWIKEAKPTLTNWVDGVVWDTSGYRRIEILDGGRLPQARVEDGMTKSSRRNITVPLGIIVDGIKMAMDDWSQFLDIEKMEVVSVCEDQFSDCYDEENEELQNEIEEDPGLRFFKLPSQYEINEYSIMEDFILSLPDEEMRDKLERAIRGSGAFRRFKDDIYRLGIDKNWYDYLDRAHRRIAIEWCEDKGFDYTE